MPILVYVEHASGKFKKSAYEAVCFGLALGKSLGEETTLLSIGNVEESVLKTFGDYGAHKVLSVNSENLHSFINQAYASILAQVANNLGATTIVMSNSFSAKGMAPRIAVKLKAAFGEAVVELPTINGEEMTIKRSVFSGKAFVYEKLKALKKVITLSPNSFPIELSKTEVVVENVTPQIDSSDLNTYLQEIIRNSDKISLPDAERVVSAGRGLKGPENWKMVEDLAEVLGAATACSKPVSDAGWRPHSEHVGQTGIAVSPNLYIAIGISGAIQHLAGVSSSKVIVVINKDPEAPFFKVADYGIVGDAFEIIPQFIEAVKSIRG